MRIHLIVFIIEYFVVLCTVSKIFKFITAGQNWMTIPQGIPNCPPGLEYLTTIDQLLVHQKVEMLEAFTGFETKNKFSIKNSFGQKVSIIYVYTHTHVYKTWG